MTNKEKLQKIIAEYTPLDYTKIDLNINIKDNYIAAEFKGNFCAQICKTWTNLNATLLKNDMFVRLRTGEDILEVLN